MPTPRGNSDEHTEPWDPYPGTIPARMPCKVCGVGPISHVGFDHGFVASWPDIEGIDPTCLMDVDLGDDEWSKT